MSWWRKRFGLNGSFADQASLVLQDFALVLLLLCCTGVIHELIQFPFLLPVKKYLEPILTVAAILLVATFEFEGVCLLIVAAVREVLASIQPGKDERKFERPTAVDSVPLCDSDSALKVFGAESAAKSILARRESETGQFTFEISEVPRAVATLGKFHYRFDAVSYCELPVWHTGGDYFAEEYFSQGADLVRQGKVVTRLFIVSPEEFEQGSDLLLPVLSKQQRAGIGYAVVAYDGLPLALREKGHALDFGLWDGGKVYSRFRQREGAWNRTMYVEFSNSCQNAGLAPKVALYQELASHIWLADKCFIDAHTPTIAAVRHVLRRNNDHLERRVVSKMSPEGTFYLEVKSHCELQQKVDALIHLRNLATNVEQTVVDEVRRSTPSAGRS